MLPLLVAALMVSTARAEDVATVLAVDGTAIVVRASGKSDAADPRVALDRADTVRTGEDGAVILLLSNNRLVRVDEDLELAVADIVQLDAPKTSATPASQLAQLLYPGERESMRGIDDAERIAGWQARLTAATAVPAQMAARTTTTTPSAELAAPDAPAPPPLTRGSPPPPPPPPPDKVVASEESPPPQSPPPDVVAKDAPPAQVVAKDAPPEADAPALEHLTRDQVLAMLAKRGELYACAKEWRVSSGLPKGTEAMLVLRIGSDGMIDRVVGDRGLAPPACVRERLEGAFTEGTDAVSVSFALP